MSAPDDALDEMNVLRRQDRLRPLDDADVVALLYGHAPYERPELEPAAALVTALRDLPQDVPAPSPTLAALLREGFVPVRPQAPTPAASPAPGRRVLVGIARASLAAKVLVGSSVALAGVATAATGGVLPDVVTERVTQLVEIVRPDPAPRPEVPRGQRPSTPDQPAEVVRPAPPVDPRAPEGRTPRPAGPPAVAPDPRATTLPEPARPGGRATPRPVPAGEQQRERPEQGNKAKDDKDDPDKARRGAAPEDRPSAPSSEGGRTGSSEERPVSDDRAARRRDTLPRASGRDS